MTYPFDPKRLRERLSERLFDRSIMQNQVRPLYVEAMIEGVIGPEWQYTGADWGGWDFVGPGDLRLEVKQSAALQSWSKGRGTTTRAIFDIAPRTGFYSNNGTDWTASPGRPAHIYVFAWHPIIDPEIADQRDPAQWLFFVVPTGSLPPSKTIGLAGVQARAAPTFITGLRDAMALAERAGVSHRTLR